MLISITCLSLVTPDRWIPSNYPITENIRAIYLTLEKLIQSEETQVNGIVILADYKGVSLSKASHFGPFIAKKVIGILQVCSAVCPAPLLWLVWLSVGPIPLLQVSEHLNPTSHSCKQRETGGVTGESLLVQFYIQLRPGSPSISEGFFCLGKISCSTRVQTPGRCFSTGCFVCLLGRWRRSPPRTQPVPPVKN